MKTSNYCRYNKTLFKVNIDGKWGIYDTELNEIIPCQYDEISVQLYISSWSRIPAHDYTPMPAPKEDWDWYNSIAFILRNANMYCLARYSSYSKKLIIGEYYDELHIYNSKVKFLTKIILVRHDKYWILLIPYSSYGYSPYDEIKIKDNKILLRRKQLIDTVTFDDVKDDIERNEKKIHQIEGEYIGKNIEYSYFKYLNSIMREKTLKKTFKEQLIGYKNYLGTKQYDK